VKHFRYEERGKRRIHRTPAIDHILACEVWLQAELAVVRPQVVVALGATAATALYGSGYEVSTQRGQVVESGGVAWTATVHPSSLLRVPPEARPAAVDAFHADLRVVAALLT
jgi:uracil-DNA glycosylase